MEKESYIVFQFPRDMSETDYQEIGLTIQRQVKENPGYADFHYQWALFETYFGHYSKAMEEVTQSLSLNPNYSQAKELEKVLQLLQAQKITDPGEMENPPICLSETHHLAALYFAQDGSMDLAEKALQKAYSITRDESQYELHHGLLDEARGDLHSAVGHLKKALELNPQSWRPYFILSQIYAVQDNMKEAGAILKQAVERFPKYADLHYHLGILQSGQGDFKEAIVHLETAVRINPKFIFAHYHLGNASLQSGDSQKAETEFARTIELGFKEASIYLDLARAQFQNEKYEDAVKSAKQAVKMDMFYTEGFVLLAEIYEKLGKTELRDMARQSADACMTGES